jgi:hypothetical protein
LFPISTFYFISGAALGRITHALPTHATTREYK